MSRKPACHSSKMKTPNLPPPSGPEFEVLMGEIDAKLAAEGTEIPGRPMMAVREVGLRYKVAMPLGGDVSRMPPDLRPQAPLSEAINQWYRDAYGDKLNVDPCPGKTVVRLDGDLYTLRIPRIFGQVNFVTSRTFFNNPGISRGPVTCNVAQLVDDLSQSKASRLSNDALSEIAISFERALPGLYTLENTPHELTQIALGDVGVAVGNLMTRQGRFGESKWASLQAAEKSLKAAIALEGATYKRTHGLGGLFDELSKVGIVVDPKPFVDAIQCTPGIRYGEETCTLEQALDAHRRSLDLVNALSAAGPQSPLRL